VYFHHTVRIASAMLIKSLSKALDAGAISKTNLLEYGDYEILSILSRTDGSAFYANSLQSRKLYKQAFSLPFNYSKNPSRIEEELSTYIDCDIIVDVPQNFFSISGFNIMMQDKKKCPIDEVSELVRALEIAESSRKRTLILCPEKNRTQVESLCKKHFSS
ncbi:hypothetical protein KJ780_01250, partial [Candidatus Micrarchaeota archaeon]|nr:hypothetical protein [Candidatus Micrarchaeota archaeon]